MNSFVTSAYIVAGILFILSLGGLSQHETARRGNLYGMIGMAIAIFATLISGKVGNMALVIPMVVVGGAIGFMLAKKVEMTQMPELVAILHSFVGMAAVLVGISNHLNPDLHLEGAVKNIHSVEIFLGVFIGAITFTGSVIAFGKLSGKVTSKPLVLPMRHLLNLAALVICILLMIPFMKTGSTFALLVMTLIAFAIGAHLVMAIGGADMPVVISMLNSYSGWAAAATGFMLANDLLIVTGALVGSSGAILSYIMCRAMNRQFLSVILGGFGDGASAGGDEAIEGEITQINIDESIQLLKDADSVIVAPGYGMAVAHAQHAVSNIIQQLRDQGKEVRFAIHPVAGRMPGHMNVLLAEANVPYDIVMEMDEINEDFPQTDVVLVIGANDIVNPAAVESSSSPLAGMPVLEVWKAKTSVVMKRSMASGYAGVENPLFYKENNRMLFGDARDVCEQIAAGLRD